MLGRDRFGSGAYLEEHMNEMVHPPSHVATLGRPTSGVAITWSIILQPAMAAVLMSASTVIVAINAQLLQRTAT